MLSLSSYGITLFIHYSRRLMTPILFMLQIKEELLITVMINRVTAASSTLHQTVLIQRNNENRIASLHARLPCVGERTWDIHEYDIPLNTPTRRYAYSQNPGKYCSHLASNSIYLKRLFGRPRGPKDFASRTTQSSLISTHVLQEEVTVRKLVIW